MYNKSKRIVDEELLATVRMQPCVCCGSKKDVDPHHITTVGAGGGDTKENVMPLCRRHHTELHAVGWRKMSWKFPMLKDWLMKNQRLDIIDRIHRSEPS